MYEVFQGREVLGVEQLAVTVIIYTHIIISATYTDQSALVVSSTYVRIDRFSYIHSKNSGMAFLSSSK